MDFDFKQTVIVIACNNAAQRKNFHECIEFANNTYSRSMKLEKLPREVKYRFCKKCIYCGHKKIPFGKYIPGMMENNKDESYQITCPKCEHSWYWECNYDDDDNIVHVYANNCIVIGNRMKPFKIKKDNPNAPVLPCVSSYESIYYHTIPVGLQVGMKNLLKLINSQEINQLLDQK